MELTSRQVVSAVEGREKSQLLSRCFNLLAVSAWNAIPNCGFKCPILEARSILPIFKWLMRILHLPASLLALELDSRDANISKCLFSSTLSVPLLASPFLAVLRKP